MSTIDLLIPTFNRLGLTKQTIDALFNTNLGVPWREIRLWIIDNASGPKTKTYLEGLKKTHGDRIYAVIYNKTNAGIVPTMAQFLRQSKKGSSLYVAKIDNDILVRRKHFFFLQKALEYFSDLQIAGACITPTQNPQKVKGYQVVEERGIRVAYARNTGGIFLARRSIFESNGYPSGDKLYGWTSYQSNLVANWRHSKKMHPVGFVKNCAITHLDVRREQNKPIGTYDLWPE